MVPLLSSISSSSIPSIFKYFLYYYYYVKRWQEGVQAFHCCVLSGWDDLYKACSLFGFSIANLWQENWALCHCYLGIEGVKVRTIELVILFFESFFLRWQWGAWAPFHRYHVCFAKPRVRSMQVAFFLFFVVKNTSSRSLLSLFSWFAKARTSFVKLILRSLLSLLF